MKSLIFGLIVLLGGCSQTNITKMIEQLGKDPANVCVTASTPYGTAAAIRTNTPGVTCSASGGECRCATPPK